MSEKKVMIITYYWPPSGGSGVQRWLKFVKYLPQFGWTPFVFTPENPAFEMRDESLLRDVPDEAEIIRFPIWEPYSLFKKFSRRKGNGAFVPDKDKSSLLQKISIWIRGNFFIPDPRVFWVRPSVKFLHSFLEENQISTIITTGPPHSVHLIGLRLKKKNPSLNWLADFRDPWSEWGFLDSLRVGFIAKSIHRRLEKKVLKMADEVITITPFYVKHFEGLSGRKVNLLTNGFDEDDFKDFVVRRSDRFYVRHIGTVNEKCDPRPFMRACAELCTRNPEIQSKLVVEFVGEVHPAFKDFVAADTTLSSITRFTSTVPHSELMEIYATSAVLLLILTGYKDAEGYMPGKLFEYLATGLPILGVGPVQGDAARMLYEEKAGVMLDDENKEGIFRCVNEYFENWRRDNSLRKMMTTKYTRRQLARDLMFLFIKK